MNNLFNENEPDISKLILDANISKENKYEELEELKQGSKAWFRARLGKFTGSKIPNLMKKGRGKEEWGLTSIGVIKRVFVERDLSDIGRELYIDELFAKRFRQTEWGNKYESYAREKYREKTKLDVEETSFEIHPDFSFIGGSFDGKIITPKENGIIEIKCPYDILVHENNTYLNEESIKKTDYYPQIQCNIEIAKVDFCDFISYDQRRINKKIHIVRVMRDCNFIAELLLRIIDAEAVLELMNTELSIEEIFLLLK